MSEINKMKAIVIESYGGSEVLQYKDIPIPNIKPDEILVHVRSAGVSPFDIHVRDGWYQTSDNYHLPIILGWELSGIVTEIGKNITRFKKGDSIFAYPDALQNGGGSYAEYAVVKESEAELKPASINYHQAAAASMNALTAWQALFEAGKLVSGQKILVHAAAGGVGHLAVQLAKWKGAYVIGTASAKNKKFLLDLGIDEFIDYQTIPFEKRVKDVDVVLDTMGDDVLERSFLTMKKGGIIVSVIDFENIKKAKDFGLQGETVIVTPNTKQLNAIAHLLEKGKIKPHVEAVFPLKEARQAHLLVQSGHVRGKVNLEIK